MKRPAFPARFSPPAFIPIEWNPDGSEARYVEMRACSGRQLADACERSAEFSDLHRLALLFKRSGGGADDLVGVVLRLPPKAKPPGTPLQVAARIHYVRRREWAIKRQQRRG